MDGLAIRLGRDASVVRIYVTVVAAVVILVDATSVRSFRAEERIRAVSARGSVRSDGEITAGVRDWLEALAVFRACRWAFVDVATKLIVSRRFCRCSGRPRFWGRPRSCWGIPLAALSVMPPRQSWTPVQRWAAS